MNTQEKIYEFRYSDLQNHKVYCVWKHANEDVWEICDDHLFYGRWIENIWRRESYQLTKKEIVLLYG